MNVAIVGTSKLTEAERILAHNLINHILDSYTDQVTVVSGGAVGVDTVAEGVAIHRGLKTNIIRPKGHEDEDYMARNREIALVCHELYCITTPTKNQKCYHHGRLQDHQKTAGCYTLNAALRMDKHAQLFILERK